jgi:hypothetical protein
MSLSTTLSTKYTFSGHESFQCRQLWLKKGYDFVKDGKSFRAEDAVVYLGVGKNMVSSIRFWLRAFSLIDSNDELTDLADFIFDTDTGVDPYLEDEATLWLLHYHLVKSKFASTYSLIFNELRREKIEFVSEHYTAFIKRKAESDSSINFNANTISGDFEVFKKMYYSDNDTKQTDDSYAGLLTDLGVVKRYVKSINKNANQKEKKESFIIENSDRKSIPIEIILYSIIDNENYGTSISLNAIEQDYGSPGSIFAINHSGLIDKINEATEIFDFLVYNDSAGIKELQFKTKPSAIDMLRSYYEK